MTFSSNSFKGFTLVELMVTVAIIGILAAIAYPSYVGHVRKGNRAAAQAEMLHIANLEQEYFLANRTYATKADLEANGYALPSNVSGKYSYSVVVSEGPPPSYVINFAATGNQVSDGDLSLNSEGVKTPADKW